MSADIRNKLGINDHSGLFGYEEWLKLLHPTDRGKFETVARAASEHLDGYFKTDIRIRRISGVYRWYRLTARGVSKDQGRHVRFIGALEDIHTEKISHDRILRDAVNDILTGLPSRSLFFDRLHREFEIAKTDKNSKLKDAAIQTQRVWQCSQGWYNHYGSPNTGLCHQATNRILYAVPYHPTVGSRVRGYYNGIGSYYIYGKYGAGWWACKRATYGKVDRNY